jgi:(p)ppGpp synthase/HD superfamily hydrolase
MMIDLALEKAALSFATAAHTSINHVRKYTGDPYIVHPIRVAEIVRTVTDDSSMIAAAYLHDTVEDVPNITVDMIQTLFGDRVASLVDDLTDVSKPSDGNRAFRKNLDFEHTAKASPDAKSVKLADLIDNCGSILVCDPNFAVRFMKEKQKLLTVLQEGNPKLFQRCSDIVAGYYATK